MTTHIPAYARELLEIRRAGLAPDGGFVIVTTEWRLAKLVREAEAIALVVRAREEPDLRGCYGLKVLIALPIVESVGAPLGLVKPGKSSPPAEYLRALDMAECLKPHELEALRAVVAPIAKACELAKAGSAYLVPYSFYLDVWGRGASQEARNKQPREPDAARR
jgi:hypothetical protein